MEKASNKIRGDNTFRNLIYTASILLALSTSSCSYFKDSSSDSEKSAKRLSEAETRYRKAFESKEESDKEFTAASTELESARKEYDTKK
jgi:hypothetical protein